MSYTCSGHDISFLSWALHIWLGYAMHLQWTDISFLFWAPTQYSVHINKFQQAVSTSGSILMVNYLLLGTSNKLSMIWTFFWAHPTHSLMIPLGTSNKFLCDMNQRSLQGGSSGGWGRKELGFFTPSHPRWGRRGDRYNLTKYQCANPIMVTGGTWSSLRWASCVAVLV